MAGHAQLFSRYPVLNHQEDAMRDKAHSKMMVATFLAGFVYTALNAVLLLQPNDWSWHRIIAASALTGSLCLLIASVYIFDQLGTPVGFWTDPPRGMWLRLGARRERRAEKRWEQTCREKDASHADEENARWRLDGPVFQLMLQTTRRVFNPAVLLGIIGFLALVVGTSNFWATAACGVMLTVAAAYAAWQRPNLGAD
jgi:hypothetical protein